MDSLLLHRIGLALLMKGKTSSSSLQNLSNSGSTIQTTLLMKKKMEIHCFTLQVRSLLLKLNRIQSLPSRDSVFRTIDKYLKQSIHVAHSLSSTMKEQWVRSTGNQGGRSHLCCWGRAVRSQAGLAKQVTLAYGLEIDSLGGQGWGRGECNKQTQPGEPIHMHM